jgi:heme A synthase
MNAIQLIRFGSILGQVSSSLAGVTLAQIVTALGQSASEERVRLFILFFVLYVVLAVIGWRMIVSAKLKDARLATYKPDMSGAWFARTFMILFGTVSIMNNYLLDWIEHGISFTWLSATILIVSIIALISGLVLELRDNSIERKLASQSQQITSELYRG